MRLCITFQTYPLLALATLVKLYVNIAFNICALFNFLVNELTIGCGALHDVLILTHLPPEAELHKLFDHFRVRWFKLLSNKPVGNLSFAFVFWTFNWKFVSISIVFYRLAQTILVICVTTLRYCRSQKNIYIFETDATFSCVLLSFLLFLIFCFYINFRLLRLYLIELKNLDNAFVSWSTRFLFRWTISMSIIDSFWKHSFHVLIDNFIILTILVWWQHA